LPDLISISATLSNDGVANMPGYNGIGFFAAAGVNIGIPSTITVAADDGGPRASAYVVDVPDRSNYGSLSCLTDANRLFLRFKDVQWRPAWVDRRCRGDPIAEL
jgi:hypothetical protein